MYDSPVTLVQNYIALINEFREELDVSESICKSTSTESILQSTNEQSTDFSTGTNAESY